MLAGEPVISNVESFNYGPHSVEIGWETDVPATSLVDYGIADVTALASPFYHSLTTTHTMVIAGLSPDTTYSFQVASTDAEGDTATSEILEFATAAIPNVQDSSIVTGGLTSYPVAMIGPNLLANPGFEEVVDDDPAGWSDNGFTVDSDVAHTGSHSYRVTDAHTIPYAQSATQELSLLPGSYRVGAWVKLDGLASTQGNGARVRLDGAGSTSIIQGTGDWRFLESTRIVTEGGPSVIYRLELHGDPDGTAWFDDVELRHELPASVEVFMRYPNYRGILFDDQSQLIDFDVTVHPPEGTVLSDFYVEASVIDEADGTTVDQQISAAVENGAVTFDGTGYSNGHTYLASFRLVRHADNVTVYEYPSYRISKLSGAVRSTMATSFDEHNRFLVHGEPTFILGVYDSGLGYTTSEASWESNLTEERHLFELPINYYLNYWYGNASAPAMTSLMNVLQNHGIQYLQTGNAFAGSYNPDSFRIHTDDEYAATLAAHPGFAGLYAADEPLAALADEVFEDYQRIKAIDPDGITFGVSNRPRELDYWRDAVDILATDPYPMYGAEPAEGYPFSVVAEDTIATREAVQDSRPFVEVLQYFQFTSKGRWPTQSELRNMSYTAIAEGANGLFFWSLGANALAYVESGWGPTKTELFSRLSNVMNELTDLKPALVGLDAPELLVGIDNEQDIHARVKTDEDGVTYIIAYNETNEPTSAVFNLSSTISDGHVRLHGESRTIATAGSSFADAFAPYEAHVYIIGDLAPQAASDIYSVLEGATLVTPAPGVLENDADPESLPLAAELMGAPSHGSLTLDGNGSFEYVPESGFTGSDSFTYRAFDGQSYSDPAVVTIVVHPDPGSTGLVANGHFERAEADGSPSDWRLGSPSHWQVVTDEAEGGAASLRLSDADQATWTPHAWQEVYLDPGIYTLEGWIKGQDLESGGAKLSLWRGPSQITSTPIVSGTTDWTLSSQAGIQITDAGIYIVRIDAHSKPSGTAWIDGVTLEADNRPAVTTPDTYSVLEGATLVTPAPGVLENDADPENLPLAAELVDDPSHGSLTLDGNGSFQYVPEPGFTGSDSFTYRAFDGQSYSDPAVVTIVVHPDPGSTGLVANGHFEKAEADGSPSDWRLGSPSHWQVVSDEAEGGAASLRLSDADQATWTPHAWQEVYLDPGIYTLEGWIKGQDLESGGAKFSLWRGSSQITSTPIVSGTTDWTLSSQAGIQITDAGIYIVRINAHSKPSGTAWIDGVTLEADNALLLAILDTNSVFARTATDSTSGDAVENDTDLEGLLWLVSSGQILPDTQ